MAINRLLVGNVAILVSTLLAFLDLLAWPISGYIIIASVLIATLTSLNPSLGRAVNSRRSKASPPATILREETDQETEQSRNRKGTQPKTRLAGSASPEARSPDSASLKHSIMPQEPAQDGNGPDAPRRIEEDDYLSFDLELEEGEEATGEVSSSADVNVYFLTEENLDALDLGQEFWYEAGAEGVRNATVQFKASEDGKWFLVVENAGNKEVFATIKLGINKTPRSTPLLKAEGLALPDAKLEGKL